MACLDDSKSAKVEDASCQVGCWCGVGFAQLAFDAVMDQGEAQSSLRSARGPLLALSTHCSQIRACHQPLAYFVPALANSAGYAKHCEEAEELITPHPEPCQVF